MKLPLANLGSAVAAWLDKELVPKSSGWQQMVTIVAGIGLANNVSSKIQQYIPMLEILGFADSNGNFDIDAIHAAAKEAFSKTGRIKVLGILIGPDDVESMMAVARRYAIEDPEEVA